MQELDVKFGAPCYKCLQQKVNCLCKPFKVGDNVRWKRPARVPTYEIHTVETVGLVENHIGLSNGYNVHIDELDHWRPKIGEWVWYGFELVQFLDTGKICRQGGDAYEEVDDTLLHPFVGKLPPCVRE